MNLFEQVQNFLAGVATKGGNGATPTPPPPQPVAPFPVANDAVAYGVTIEPARVAPDALYWQAVEVHHCTPQENGGNHHIYVDMLDPAPGTQTSPFGQRVAGARARVSWEGADQTITLDKPLGEPGTSFPMWKWQVCSLLALGVPGQELPSDRVAGLHTGHPDEAPGNAMFHHSFRVVFSRVQAPKVIHADSVIYGVVHHAAGRTALLMQGSETLARQAILADEAFRFTGLIAGNYSVAVEGSTLRSEAKTVDGQNEVQFDLTLVLADSEIAGRVRGGAGRRLTLMRETTEVDAQIVAGADTYRFSGLPAGTYRVILAGTPISSAALALDGTNSLSADLGPPPLDRPLSHYVLFGAAELPATRVNLLLAQEFILTFGASFGFSPQEAAGASLVTIVGDIAAIPPQVDAELATHGALVQRIAGDAQAVADAFAARVASGRALG